MHHGELIGAMALDRDNTVQVLAIKFAQDNLIKDRYTVPACTDVPRF